MVSLRKYIGTGCVCNVVAACMSVLLFAGCSPSIHDAVARSGPDFVAALLEKNPDRILLTDGKGKTALHAAVTYGRTDLMPLLLKYDANANRQDITGMTPLHVAGMLGRLDEAKWLLAHGADPLIEDKYGDTPLHTAVVFGHGQIIKLLVEHGISPERPNGNGETPITIATNYRQEKVVKYLNYLSDPKPSSGP
jgi:uncharacterized protein